MKKKTLFLILILVLAYMANAQVSCRNGYRFPCKDTVRIFLVFAQADGDPQDTIPDNPQWRRDSMPTDPNAFFDYVFNPQSINGFMTKYFYQMSYGQYIVIGDYFPSLVKLDYSTLNGSGDGNVISYLNNLPGSDVTTAHGFTINSNDFDIWSSSPGNGLPIAKTPNNKIDMVLILWRVNSKVAIKDQSGSISLGDWAFTLKNKTGSQTFGRFRSFHANPGIMRHEFAHAIFGPNEMHAGGAGDGDRFFMSNVGGYSILSSWNYMSEIYNAYDRYRLGYKKNNPPSYIYATNAVSQNIVSTDFEYGQSLLSGNLFILRDFATYGDAIRIKLPYLKSESASINDQWLWLVNHQMISGNIDHNVNRTKGIYANIQVNKNDTTSFTGPNDYYYPLSAFGSYDFQFDTISTKSYTELGLEELIYNDTANLYSVLNVTTMQTADSTNENPFTGYNPLMCQAYDLNGNNVMPSNEVIQALKTKINGYEIPAAECNYMQYTAFGSDYDAFVEGDIIGIGTNPSNTPLLTYKTKSTSSLNPYSTFTPNDNRKIFLNGMQIEIVEQLANGDIKVRIRWDKFDVNNNVRWCGDIVLNEQVRLKSNKSIILDWGKTPQRPLNPITVNSFKYFSDSTKFNCNDGSYFLQETNTSVNVVNHSTLILKSGSLFELQAGAILNIDSSSHFIMQPGCSLLVREGATVYIDYGSDFKYNGGTITLEGTNSKLEIAGILDIAANKTFTFNGNGFVKFSSPLVPSENIKAHIGSSIEFVGSGRTDLVVDISQESLYIPDSVVNFTLHNALVYMHDNSARLAVLWGSSVIDIYNVKFSPQSPNRTSHRGLQVFGQQNCLIDSCYFEKGTYGVYGYLTYYGAPLEITDSYFDDCQFGVWAHDKELRLINCSFTDCDYGTWAQNMTFTNSKIEDSGYLQNDYGVYYSGGSGANLLITNTDIGWSSYYGLRSIGALTTTIRCSDIYSNGTCGASIESSGFLNMNNNATPQGGKSRVYNNTSYNLSFFFANSPDIGNGYNDFSKSSGAMLISGLLNGGCNLKLAAIPATYNRWFYPTNNDPVNATNYDLQVFGCNPVKRFTMTTSPLGNYETCGSGGGTLSIGGGEEEIVVSEIEQTALEIALENEDYYLALDYYYNDLFSTGSLLSNNQSKDYDKIWEGIKYCFGQIRNQAPAMTNAGSQVFNKVEMALNKMKQINANNPKRLFFLDLEHATLFRSVGDEITAIQKLNNMLAVLTENDEIQETEYWLCIIQTEREIKLGNILPQDIENYNNTCESIINTKQQRINNNNELHTPITNDIVLSVIPNPVTSQSVINIELIDKSSAIVEIIDTEGKAIKVFNLTEQKSTINVRSNDLPKGVYTVKVMTSGGLTKTTRMIIQ